MRILCFLGFCSMMSPGLLGQKKGLSMVYQWKQLDYAYDTAAAREHDISTGVFVPGNSVPIDVDIHYEANKQTKVFVTVPRFQDGIPSTLNTVSKEVKTNGSTVLVPYPAWSWNQNSEQCNNDRIVSVFRIQVDECGRLWVLDTGKIGSKQLCKPQIIAFDVNTDKVIHRYEVPDDQITQQSLLVTPVVDVRDPQSGCKDTFVYAADVTGFGLIVYDVTNKRSWRITNKLFFPTPEYGTFNIAGESFDLMDGILGMALSPNIEGQDRVLYFHSLASVTENYVYTSVIRNGTLFHDSPDALPREFQAFSRKRPSQAAAEAIDKHGVMYFGLAHEIAIACWNTGTDFGDRNFDLVDRNPETLQFASGVKVVTNRKGKEELWVLTCRFQKAMTGTMNPNEINFRIQAATTSDLIRGSKCKNRAPANGGSGGGYGFPRPQYGAGSYGKSNMRPQRDTSKEQFVFQN